MGAGAGAAALACIPGAESVAAPRAGLRAPRPRVRRGSRPGPPPEKPWSSARASSAASSTALTARRSVEVHCREYKQPVLHLQLQQQSNRDSRQGAHRRVCRTWRAYLAGRGFQMRCG